MPETRRSPQTGNPTEAHALLRRHGFRCTPGRLRILETLRAAGGHLSIGEACARLAESGKAVHPATVYRTLEALTDAGLTHTMPGPGPARYGLTERPHHHAVCRACGAVATLEPERLADVAARIEEVTGIGPDASGSLFVYGHCAGCAGRRTRGEG
ncbi:Fur family transcriptional regulator [Streptomyces sp. NPDC004539]|uniref:Fur family transcriptional regulator n=1 Tax=Streptomyces sp. NPDC004539 TaxID=3154280 RepID=UPI0033B879D3